MHICNTELPVPRFLALLTSDINSYVKEEKEDIKHY